MMKNLLFTTMLFIVSNSAVCAQADTVLSPKPLKIHHAEPLYMDLVRDLGARKGEKEWNVGYGMEGHKDYTLNHAFVEYEFAPVNRLGLEVEVPFAFYKSVNTQEDVAIPRSRIEGLKVAAQYTFLVSDKYQMSMAGGYVHEFRTHSFYSIQKGRGMLKGNAASPFFVVAKKWGSRLHTMLYTGPEWEVTLKESAYILYGKINASMHFVLPSGNFLGVEVNDEFSSSSHQLVVRPQMKLVLKSNLALGFLAGVPVDLYAHGMSWMARVIWEPGRKK